LVGVVDKPNCCNNDYTVALWLCGIVSYKSFAHCQDAELSLIRVYHIRRLVDCEYTNLITC